MYGWGGEAFFCPRRLPSRENARGERWPYAGAPLTIRIYVEATLTIHIYVYTHHSPYIYTHHSPYAGTPLSHYCSSAPKQPHLWLPTIHTVTWLGIFQVPTYAVGTKVTLVWCNTTHVVTLVTVVTENQGGIVSAKLAYNDKSTINIHLLNTICQRQLHNFFEQNQY